MHIEVTPSKGRQSRFLQKVFYVGIFSATFFIYSLKFQCAVSIPQLFANVKLTHLRSCSQSSSGLILKAEFCSM